MILIQLKHLNDIILNTTEVRGLKKLSLMMLIGG